MRNLRSELVLMGAALLVGACADSRGRVGGISQTTVQGKGGAELTLVKPHNVDMRRGEAESVIVRIRRDRSCRAAWRRWTRRSPRRQIAWN
jgi:hypothetical protein